MIDRTSLLRCISSRFLKLFSILPTNFRATKKQVICLPHHTLLILWPKNKLPFRMRFTDEWTFIPYSFISVIPSQPIRLVVLYITPPQDGLSCLIPRVLWFFHNLSTHLILLTNAGTMFSCISLSVPNTDNFFIHLLLSMPLLSILLHTSSVSSSCRSSVSTHLQQMTGGQPQQSALRGPSYCVKSSINHNVIVLVTLNSQR